MTPPLRGSSKRRADWGALWGDLHYPGRRRRLRDFLCELGLHYPIRYGETYSYSSYEPPEPAWLCERCCHERLPYRAFLWSNPWARILPVFILKRL